MNVGDVTGFSVRRATKQDKKNGASAFQQVIVVQGGGTELASCAVNHGTADKIQAWIRAHPSFVGNTSTARAPHATASSDIADQLTKLAQLRDTGVLSQREFDQAKAKLLG